MSQREVWTPDPATTTVTTAWTVVLGPHDVMRFGQKTIQLRNTGAVGLSGAEVQMSCYPQPSTDPDDTTEWETVQILDPVSLVVQPNETATASVSDDAHRHIRVRAKVAAGTTTIKSALNAGSW